MTIKWRSYSSNLISQHWLVKNCELASRWLNVSFSDKNMEGELNFSHATSWKFYVSVSFCIFPFLGKNLAREYLNGLSHTENWNIDFSKSSSAKLTDHWLVVGMTPCMNWLSWIITLFPTVDNFLKCWDSSSYSYISWFHEKKNTISMK